MIRLRGERSGERDWAGNHYYEAEDGYWYKEDEYGILHETSETIRLKAKKEEEKRRREAQPGFFDDLPTFGSLLSKNIEEENQRRAMKKAEREQKFNATLNAAVSVGGILLAVAKEAGQTESKPQRPARSKQEYMDMMDDMFD